MLASRRFSLIREKMPGFLDKLEANSSDAAWSYYLPPGISKQETEILLTGLMGQEVMPAELFEVAAGAKTGAIVFSGPERKYLVLPPFPILEKSFKRGFSVQPLRALLAHDLRIALVLVRLGSYAIGICQGEKLVSSKVGTGLIHGRHKKGGSSQQRFRRHREKQIESFLNRVCSHIQDYFEPQKQLLDYLVYGGAWTTILSLQKQCSFLNQFDNRLLPPLLDIPEPRQAVLETAVSRTWSSHITEWYDEQAIP